MSVLPYNRPKDVVILLILHSFKTIFKYSLVRYLFRDFLWLKLKTCSVLTKKMKSNKITLCFWHNNNVHVYNFRLRAFNNKNKCGKTKVNNKYYYIMIYYYVTLPRIVLCIKLHYKILFIYIVSHMLQRMRFFFYIHTYSTKSAFHYFSL